MAHRRSRIGPLLWSLLVCPIIGLVAGLAAGRGDSPKIAVLTFIAVPAALSVLGLIVMRRSRVEVIVLAILSAAIEGATVLLLFIALASRGIYDT